MLTVEMLILNSFPEQLGHRNGIFAFKPAPIQVMWLGFPGTSGATYMDYIITDEITSPLEFENQYSEKLAHMPYTYIIGDHKQMFPHLSGSVIVKIRRVNINQTDDVIVVNGTNLSLLYKTIGINTNQKSVDVSMTQSAITAFETMIASRHMKTVINGVVLQNGLFTSTNEKVASGEEVPKNMVITSRQHYGLAADTIVYCNSNQLYKLDPLTFASWVTILENVPNAVLWLLRFPAEGEPNILETAQNLGKLLIAIG